MKKVKEFDKEEFEEFTKKFTGSEITEAPMALVPRFLSISPELRNKTPYPPTNPKTYSHLNLK